MDSISINFGAKCQFDDNGETISVMITAKEYDYLCRMLQRKNDISNSKVTHKTLDYETFRDMVEETLVAEWREAQRMDVTKDTDTSKTKKETKGGTYDE